MPQFKIAGTIKLTSPLHVATPGDCVIDLHSLRISYGEADSSHLNLTGTTIYPLALSEEEMLSEGMETESLKNPNEGGNAYLPIFPANDARGRLRRLAAAEVFGLLESRGEKLTLETYHGMTCGAATGPPNKEITFDFAVKAGKHIGLFGGGPRMVPSSFQVNTLWPITSATIKGGLVSFYFEDEKVLVGSSYRAIGGVESMIAGPIP